MSLTKVFILNGPANSGKDVGVEHLLSSDIFDSHDEVHHRQFKSMLYKFTAFQFNIREERLMELLHRDTKELVSQELWQKGEDGLVTHYSPRAALIHVSEEIIKKSFGEDYLGRCLADSIEPGITFVSDGGFVDEIKPIANLVGAENVHILRIVRSVSGKILDFEGDSRKYIDKVSLEEAGLGGVSITPVTNSGTLEEFFSSLRVTVKSIVLSDLLDINKNVETWDE